MEQTLGSTNKILQMVVSVYHRSHQSFFLCKFIFKYILVNTDTMHNGAKEQLEAVVKELYNKSGNKKWPLILLHKKRVNALLENPNHRNVVEEWISNDVLYTTPLGSNDD